MVSARAEFACAPRRSGARCAMAQPHAPATRRVRNQARRGARGLGRQQAVRLPTRALAPPMPGSGRWHRTVARLAPCQSLAASPAGTGGNCSCPEGRPEYAHIAEYLLVPPRVRTPGSKAQNSGLWSLGGRPPAEHMSLYWTVGHLSSIPDGLLLHSGSWVRAGSGARVGTDGDGRVRWAGGSCRTSGEGRLRIRRNAGIACAAVPACRAGGRGDR